MFWVTCVGWNTDHSRLDKLHTPDINFLPLPPTRENLIVEGDWHSTTEVEAFSLAKPQVICADKI